MLILLYKGEGERFNNYIFIGLLEFINIYFNFKVEFDILFEIDVSGMLNVYLMLINFE